MATLTEMVAALVVHSSAAALSHLGVVLDTPTAQPPAAEQRIVARSPRPVAASPMVKASACPDAARAHLIKA